MSAKSEMPPMVCVVWEDPSWSMDEAPDAPGVVFTTGWLTEEGDESLVVSSEWIGGLGFRSHTRIPYFNVMSVRGLKEVR